MVHTSLSVTERTDVDRPAGMLSYYRVSPHQGNWDLRMGPGCGQSERTL